MSKAVKEDRKASSKGSRQSKVSVEFPVEAEEIGSPTYTFRVQALPDTTKVEISINGKPWEKCREALGNWWFDWKGYAPGKYEIVARAINANEEKAISDRRRFSVLMGDQE